MTAVADRFALVRDRELRDLIEYLEEIEGDLLDARAHVPDDFIDLTNDARAAIAKAIVCLCQVREAAS